jgi:hypothetical protein
MQVTHQHLQSLYQLLTMQETEIVSLQEKLQEELRQKQILRQQIEIGTKDPTMNGQAMIGAPKE